MKIEQLPIYPAAEHCGLTLYRHQENIPGVPPRRAVIVCPGGGYLNLSGREDEIVALQYLAAGFQVFILHYGVGANAANYTPLIQACCAIRYIREHAAALNVRPDRIFITGFSAGGHCASAAATMYKHNAVKQAFVEHFGDDDVRLGRPDGAILCYPVISSGEYGHRGSFSTLCGDPNASDEALREFSTDLWVDNDTPPAFLWHTADDPVVPVQNSLLYTMALSACKIPFECHIYPHGEHGLSLCDERTWVGNPALLSPVAAPWIDHAIRWAQQL
ncbi:MAG: alpha/beta hydrolase [Clostridia bacterium]|nr:alpha/beta hydrolase [Clostridia bacterium]